MNDLSYRDRLTLYISVIWFLLSAAYSAGTYEPGDSISGAVFYSIIPVIAIWLFTFTLRTKEVLVMLSIAWVVTTIASVTVDDNGISVGSVGMWICWVILLTILPLLMVWIGRREIID